MANITISGLELLKDSESYLNDITDEMSVVGGLIVINNSEIGFQQNNEFSSQGQVNVNINSTIDVS